MKFKGAIFDLDGTLLDSLGIWRKIDVDFLARRGLAVPDDYVEIITPMGFLETAIYTKNRFELAESPEEIMSEWQRMSVEAYKSSVSMKPNAKSYLLSLKSRGVKLAIATASNEELFAPVLERSSVYHLFDAITTLNEVGRGKGSPDIYLNAAAKLGLSPSECVVFEDIYAGLKSAKDAGFFVAGVYDSNADYERDKIIGICDLYVTGFDELINGRDPFLA